MVEHGATIWVGGLPNTISDESLAGIFADFGDVVSTKVFPEKWYGFVNFCSAAEAARVAEAFDGATWEGRKLRVKVKTKETKGSANFAVGGDPDVEGASMTDHSDATWASLNGAAGGGYGMTDDSDAIWASLNGVPGGGYGRARGGSGAGQRMSPYSQEALKSQTYIAKAPPGRGRVRWQLCKYFPEGKCHKGPACTFAHSESELGTVATSRPDEQWEPWRKVEQSWDSVAWNEAEFASGLGAGPYNTETAANRDHKAGFASGDDGDPYGVEHFSFNGVDESAASFGKAPTGARVVPPPVRPYAAAGKPPANARHHSAAIGTSCTSTHNESELGTMVGVAPNSMQVLQGAAGCKGGGYVKWKLCKFFANYGECTKGNACTFAHGEDELGTPAGRGAGDRVLQESGAQAPRVQTKWEMCRHFPVGKCWKGDQCTFAHSEDEIGTTVVVEVARGKAQPHPGAAGGNNLARETKDFAERGKLALGVALGATKGDAREVAHGDEELQSGESIDPEKLGSSTEKPLDELQSAESMDPEMLGSICPSQDGILVGKREDYTEGDPNSVVEVAGLPDLADDLYLYKIFGPMGAVLAAFIQDTNDGRSGVVTFHTGVEAQYAVDRLDGARTANETQLRVSVQ